MTSDDDLIQALSRNLQAVAPPARIDHIWLGWLVLSAAFVVGVIHLMGPVRDSSLDQLLSGGRFTFETVLGITAFIAGSLAAFRSAVPGGLSRWLARIAVGLLLAWIGFYLFGLYSPALEPSMAGKRDRCVWETFVYAAPPMLVAIGLIRRYCPLQPFRTAMAAGIVAGMLPALYMQLACMYVPAHILSFHILPGLLVGPAAVGVAWVWQFAVARRSQ
ncbi:DUF1109 domain-containing protein [Halieaceae bacterium IMCC14734]|uniref:DUF1109 domain-containing protein n=1 Tax=Candidatus Litorirhabdus singularis TaxID=2518993 RepID=A0ABT3TEU8_9GAMM|nr:NrsF family protein [Candidatus Litorirhabdus singularis]MCX2980715.1 DUF1109 domain-containing protein [Candidatus Litorirhabdus singularis]